MNKLPMTVIGGYLGAGKTTLINRLLQEDHGLRIMVLVNDFGAINIDADLLISSDEDTLELANGCVCCTMGAELFTAVGKVLDRPDRPDHLVIEASGVADPARIANVARAEPDLRYAGIVTVVDGENCAELLGDPQIAPQIEDQIACADLLAISKTPHDATLTDRLRDLNAKADIAQTDHLPSAALLLCGHDIPVTQDEPHLHYSKWSHVSDQAIDPAELSHAIKHRPAALYRMKGWVRGPNDQGALVQVAGSQIEITPISQPEQTTLVGIGLATRLSDSDCSNWWTQVTANRAETPRVLPQPVLTGATFKGLTPAQGSFE